MRTLLIMFLAAQAAPSVSVSPAQPDVEHYRLLIHPDFASHAYDVVATLRVVSNGAPELRLSLNPALHIASVKVDGRPAPLTRNGWQLTLPLPKRARCSVSFEMRGAPGSSGDEDRPVVADSSLFLLWSDRFYPLDFTDWATVETELVLPANYVGFAPGKLESRKKATDGVHWLFRESHPARKYTVMADARWAEHSRVVDRLPMRTLLFASDTGFREQIYRTSREVVRYYSELYAPYPFDVFTFAAVDGIYARRALAGGVAYSSAWIAQELRRNGFDGHETALLWWGYLSGGIGPGDSQWTEGFGDYAEVLYDEFLGHPLEFYLARARERYLMAAADSEPGYANLRGSTPQQFIHGRYPWLMHLVRYEVGDEAFRRAMRRLFERYSHRGFTMEHLVRTMEEGSGTSLARWRAQWLERKGVPTLDWSVRVDTATAGQRVQIIIEQRAALYELPIEVALRTTRDTLLRRVNLDGNRVIVTFESDAPVVEIELDPREWILARWITPRRKSLR